MINLLSGQNWRDVLDLEHAQIYEPDNAWVALTGERYKYIYFTLTGDEQLFDLENDPHELVNLAESEIPLNDEWRQRMIDHLEIRGEEWIKDGELLIQDSSIYFGRNHPALQADK